MAKINKNLYLDVLRSVLISIIVSFILILAFAIIVKYANLGEKVISYVNVAIKIISILTGIFIGLKECSNGLFKGALSGLLFTLMSFLIFALLDKGFTNAHFTIIDIIIGAVVGLISGIITVNVKKCN
ncbi:MAG: TIGR04086 family membrane protein [Clostridia bacterium]